MIRTQNGFKAKRGTCEVLAWGVLLLGFAIASTATRAEDPVIDCPLRDVPYSVDTPLMDVMVNPAAKTMLETDYPELMKRVPKLFLNTEPPSLSAIMTLRRVVDLLRMPMDAAALEKLDSNLANIELTANAKRARCARYDNDAPTLTLSSGGKQILVFDKVTGYDHGLSVGAATETIKNIAQKRGWGVSVTNKGGAFSPEILKKFDLVVWNNVSGDVLTLSQRRAFEDYIQQGGGYLGVHGSGGDFIYLWDWYALSLLGAQFIGHTMSPHYQDAEVVMERSDNHIADGLPARWKLNEEWYSFESSPRKNGSAIVASVDEATYKPEMGGLSLRMGDDHPIAWARCVGEGRSFYTAIGHRPEVYQVKENVALLENGLVWAAGAGKATCAKPWYKRIF